VSHDIAFLWYERGAWQVQLPYGPSGSGISQEDSIGALREALRERRRTIERRTPASRAEDILTAMLASSKSKSKSKSSKASEQSWAEEFERIGLEDCILIAPDAFAALVAEQCKQRPARELRALRESPLLYGREEPRPVNCLSDHPVGSWLRRHRIIWVRSELYDLPVASHWTLDRAGLFAFDGSTLLHLDGSVEKLRTLLQADCPLLDDVDPAAVAGLVVESVGRRGKAHHTLATVESLEHMEDSGEYVLDRRELARISPLPAAMLDTSKDGWILRFATRFGKLGMDDEIYEWRVELSRTFEVEVKVDLLSTRIFASRPFVIE